MKKQIQTLLLIALSVGMTIPAWGQSSTEGKEFWVALTLSAAPADGLPTPFIAVSTKKPTTITITNPGDQTWAGTTKTVGANEWVIFESEIPLNKWYPTAANSINDIKPEAGQTHNYGLKVEATEEVSVYAALWMTNSFDAANVLPSHVLQHEYYVQDYPPYIKPSDGDALSMFTIVATEDNTRVTITPSSTTQDNHVADVPYNVTLNAGQTYYVISQTLQSLSGTHVISNGKKIAVFQGNVFTQIPGGKSARDCTYEQAMPVEYWGTHFVVTRSKEKDANRIRVTASNNGTSIMLDGIEMTTLNAGETWELEMHQTEPTQADLKHRPDAKIVSDAVYLQASCPVAVYSYDVSNGYKSTPSEMDNNRGDPSMVWISPLEQRINDITFGVCGTEKTDKHYINIVCPTEATSLTTITPTPAEAVTWTAVPSNPEWSYARIHLSTVKKAGSGNRVFTMKNPQGCIAHVYGNGNDESYAYSVGSAAVKRGVRVNNEIFTDGYRSDSKYCLHDIIHFNAGIGTDEISRVDWNFGDGTTEEFSTPEIDHQYLSPGWFDVTAELYGHQVCTDESNQYLGSIQFSFRVVKRDTLPGTVQYRCLSLDTLANDPERRAYILQYGENDTVVPDICSEPVVINYLVYGEEKTDTIDRYDSAYVNGDWYYYTQDIVYTPQALPGQTACDVHCHIHIIQCLDLKVTNMPEEQHLCPGDALKLTYSKRKGDIGGAAHFVIPGLVDELVNIDNTNVTSADLSLPTHVVQKPGVYHATLTVPDLYCDTLTFPVDFTVYYPSNIFKRKFNNVLAVYNKDFNGGYSFTHYEWHLIREGLDTIIGGDESIYHQDMPFMQNDTVYVVLTDNKGLTLPSCIQVWENDPYDWPESEQQNAPAQKEIRNQRMYIRIDDRVYDMYGQRVQ